LRPADLQDLLSLILGVVFGFLAACRFTRTHQAGGGNASEGSRVASAAPEPSLADFDRQRRGAPERPQSGGSRDGLSCLNLGALQSLFLPKNASSRSSPSARSNLSHSSTAPLVVTSKEAKLKRLQTSRGVKRETEEGLKSEYTAELQKRLQLARAPRIAIPQMGRPRRNLEALLRSASRKGLGVPKDVAFLNRFAELLWPQVASHIKNVLFDVVEPAINSKLPSLLKGHVHFQDVSLGKNSPHFGNAVVLESLAKDKIELRMGVKLESDLRASVVAPGARVRVANLVVNGELSIVFGPLMPSPPYFGGLEIFFDNPIDLGLTLGGNIIPKGLHPALCSAIAGAIARFMVLPHRIAVDLNPEDDVDKTDIKFSDPVGVLQLTILRASGLAASDISLFGAKSSDPYVAVSLGASRWVSPTIKKSLNPVWGEDGKGITFELPIHSPSQFVKFEVFDADIASSDDLIGTRSGVELMGLLNQDGSAWREVPLQLLDASGNPTAGTLFVSGRLLQLTSVPRPLNAVPLGGSAGAYLAIKILEIQNLPSTGLYPYKVRATVGEQTSTTHGSFSTNVGMSAVLERVCMEQLKAGQPPALVARALGLSEAEVEQVALKLGLNHHDSDIQAIVRKSVAKRHAMNPHFEEKLQLLIPDPAAPGTTTFVKLELLDKAGSVIGSAEISFAEVLRAPDLRLVGMIPLESGKAMLPAGADLLGSLQLRFLDV